MSLCLNSKICAFLATTMFSVAAIAAKKPFEPIRETDGIALFSAKKMDAANICRTGQKGGTAPIIKSIQKGVNISFQGAKGRSLASFPTDIKKLDALLKENALPCGLKLVIDYPHNAYGKLLVQTTFSDKTMLAREITLEKGAKEYVVDKGFRRAGHPPRWNLLSKVSLIAKKGGNGLSLNLKKIILLEKEKEKNKFSSKKLKIKDIRLGKEIYPAKGKISFDGKMDEEIWENAVKLEDFYWAKSGDYVSGKDSPFSVKLAYDEENFYVGSESSLKAPPMANVLQADGGVWQDEAIEYFFSNDNVDKQKIQFVTNAKGTIFDCAIEYIPNAERNKIKISRNIGHEKGMIYDGGKWSVEIAFPWSELKINSQKQRFFSFQIAQDYPKKKEALCWRKPIAGRLPNEKGFGIITLNKSPFGSGKIIPASVIKTGEGEFADFALECELNDFAPGTYKATNTLTSPGNTIIRKSEDIKISSKKQKTTFTLRSAVNKDGIYTYCLSLQNKKDDSRTVAINVENSIEYGDMFGENILIPEPKKMRLEGGKFIAENCPAIYISSEATKRTLKTAQIFARKFYEFTGKRLPIKKVDNLNSKKSGIIMQIDSSQKAPPKKEGYRLVINKDKAAMTGHDEPGLYYAGITFVQLLKNSMQIKKGHPVPCVDISDWPDLEHRMVMLHHPTRLRKRAFKEHT